MALAVEGSARTLTWVEVIPSTGVGVGVGCATGGVTVFEGAGVRVADGLDGMTRGVGVDMVSSLALDLQPVYKRIKTVKITLENRLVTLGFYRLSCLWMSFQRFAGNAMTKTNAALTVYLFTLQESSRSEHWRIRRRALLYSNPVFD
jgi:hypothetical protein